jgi:hypothetical protein
LRAMVRRAIVIPQDAALRIKQSDSLRIEHAIVDTLRGGRRAGNRIGLKHGGIC